MNRLRLGAICAGIAAGLAVTYGSFAHDFSALKDSSGNPVGTGFGSCVESGSDGGAGGGCGGASAGAAKAKAAAAPEKPAMAPAPAAPSAAAPGGAGAGAAGAAAAADTKAMAASAEAGAMGEGNVGDASAGHLKSADNKPVKTGFGGCVNLGYSVNSPDHPADCEIQPKKMAAAPKPAAPAPAPAPAEKPAEKPKDTAPPFKVTEQDRTKPPVEAGAAAEGAPPAPDTSVPPRGPSNRRAPAGAMSEPLPETAAAAAPAPKPAPPPPPVAVPGTVRSTEPVGETQMAQAEEAPKAAPVPPAIPAPAGGAAPRVIEDARMKAIPPPQRAEIAAVEEAPQQASPPPAAIPAPPGAPAKPSQAAPAPEAPAAKPAAPAAPAAQAQAQAPAGAVEVPPARATAQVAPEYEKITLGTDVLFKFDKYLDKDMLPGGKEKLDDVASKITSYEKATIQSITVTGHTDRVGSNSYNQKLSERRADTVKNYLVNKGVEGSKVSAQGKGETQPVVHCKGNQVTKKLIACLQPNRRVEVEIRGTKQK